MCPSLAAGFSIVKREAGDGSGSGIRRLSAAQQVEEIFSRDKTQGVQQSESEVAAPTKVTFTSASEPASGGRRDADSRLPEIIEIPAFLRKKKNPSAGAE